MVCWCLCPLITSLENDLGLYDGLSAGLGIPVRWGLPYLIGRLYFGDLHGIRELTVGIVGGVSRTFLPRLLKSEMTPMLRGLIYGMPGWTDSGSVATARKFFWQTVWNMESG